MAVPLILLRAAYLANRLNVTEPFKRSLHISNMNLTSSQQYSDMSSVREEFAKIPGKGKLTLEKDEQTGIAIMTIEHEERKNAFTAPMIVDLYDAVLDLESWESGKGLIVWGGSKYFSSGGDLEMARHVVSESKVGMMSSILQDSLFRLLNLPLVSVAVVNGTALGGGCELAVSCDYRLMARDAHLHCVQKLMGVVPGSGGVPILVNLVGRTLALDMLVGCKKIGAEEAVKLGLASGIVTPGEAALSEGREWLKEKVEGATEAVRGMKQIVALSHKPGSLKETLALENKLFSTLFGGAAHIRLLEQHIKHKK